MLRSLLPASFLLPLGTNSTGKQSVLGGPFLVCDPMAAAHQRGGTGKVFVHPLYLPHLDPLLPAVHSLCNCPFDLPPCWGPPCAVGVWLLSSY